jgi:hypothetical protein
MAFRSPGCSLSIYHSSPMNKFVCVACRRKIDAAAKICPYCGADPLTGQKIDTQAILDEVFHPRRLSTSESILEYARQRQGIVIALSVAAGFLVLAALHQFVKMRNESAVSASPAVPLTEVADLRSQPENAKTVPMPDLKFQYDGRPQKMRTFILEPGAVPPPEVAGAAPVPALSGVEGSPPARAAEGSGVPPRP